MKTLFSGLCLGIVVMKRLVFFLAYTVKCKFVGAMKNMFFKKYPQLIKQCYYTSYIGQLLLVIKCNQREECCVRSPTPPT